MKTTSVVLAIATLALSAGVASAQTNRNVQTERSLTGGAQMNGYDGRSQMTGAPSSSNPQAGGGPNGLLTAPHSVPENGGAAMMEVNPPMRRWALAKWGSLGPPFFS
jgi:hypothetical protein